MTDQLTEKALAEVRGLSQEIFSDLDQTHGGITWWVGHGVPETDILQLSDYVLDAVNGIGHHLGVADYFLGEYERARTSADFFLRGRMRKNGGDPMARDPETARADQTSDLKLRSLVYGFLSAASSVLDTLSGAVIGVAGLGLPIVKADLGMFSPFDCSDGYPSQKIRVGKALHPAPEAAALQLGLIRAFRSSLLQAGPDGWHVWLNHKRNQLSHRGARLQLHAFPRRGQGPDSERWIVLDRDPDLTTIQGFEGTSTTVESMHLLEDETTTMTGLLHSLNAVVIETLIAARHVWAVRRSQPMIIPQPSSQWHGEGRRSGFDGYAPKKDLYKDLGAVVVNPVEATRLAATQNINKRRG